MDHTHTKASLTYNQDKHILRKSGTSAAIPQKISRHVLENDPESLFYKHIIGSKKKKRSCQCSLSGLGGP